MDLAQARRYTRHVALPEVGPEGQTRILKARVLLVNLAAGALETAAVYLAAAGVSSFEAILAPAVEAAGCSQIELLGSYGARLAVRPRPTSGSGWVETLTGVTVALRGDFGDDSFVEACRQVGVPAVVLRSQRDAEGQKLDLLSLRPAPPSEGADVPSFPPSPEAAEAADALAASAAVLAGTLAATEALWLICGRPEPNAPLGCMQHLAFPVSVPPRRPSTYTIPWPSRS